MKDRRGKIKEVEEGLAYLLDINEENERKLCTKKNGGCLV